MVCIKAANGVYEWLTVQYNVGRWLMGMWLVVYGGDRWYP